MELPWDILRYSELRYAEVLTHFFYIELNIPLMLFQLREVPDTPTTLIFKRLRPWLPS